MKIQLSMKKIIQFLFSAIFCVLVCSSLKSNNTAFAATTESKAISNNYKNLNLRLKTTSNNLNIFAKIYKKQNIKFKLAAGSKNYLINPNLTRYSFKKKNLQQKVKVNIFEKEKTEYKLISSCKGEYRRILNKKKYSYYLDLKIPLKKIDPNITESTIMQLKPITSKTQKRGIFTIGLSTFPIIPVILCVLIILCVYILSILKRAKIFGVYFWVASIGTFVIITFLFHKPLLRWMAWFVSWILSFIGDRLNLFTSILNQNMMYLFSHGNLVQIKIDYECSGVLELLVFESLLIFYPIFSPLEKILHSLEGFLWITGANIIRIMLVILSIKYIGTNGLYMSYLIISRIIFYALTIILYYNVFTKSQIIKGWRKK